MTLKEKMGSGCVLSWQNMFPDCVFEGDRLEEV